VVLSFFIVIAVGVLFWLQRMITARRRHVTISGKSSYASKIPLGRWKWVARTLMLVYLAAASVVPLLGLFFVSLQRFWSSHITRQSFTLDVLQALFTGDNLTKKALQTSVFLGIVGATLGILIATMLMLYVRQRQGNVSEARGRGRQGAERSVAHGARPCDGDRARRVSLLPRGHADDPAHRLSRHLHAAGGDLDGIGHRPGRGRAPRSVVVAAHRSRARSSGSRCL
jgi:hypothetical protein